MSDNCHNSPLGAARVWLHPLLRTMQVSATIDAAYPPGAFGCSDENSILFFNCCLFQPCGGNKARRCWRPLKRATKPQQASVTAPSTVVARALRMGKQWF